MCCPVRFRVRAGDREKVELAALYALNLATGYLLMLACMTYNVGAFAAVLLGMGSGFLLFFDRAPGLAGRGDSCHGRMASLVGDHD